ncbi:hypothetical protein HA72_0594 [Metallosphaera sedula]|uniref:Uncharacterized protein n=3 Tax=Metallosphaera TaxID=41980 RepID=A4YEB7_METS5|nr:MULTISPECIES: hypothetical protein [Metallosphaera]ABP94769.1 hypothetical protein Msed_0594 [Metallosphaera sedula DSM 5348]AIM26756.1 hypothetical protein HA72_0594 [Metallosphaera sedula]AKV73711.1 hypothetical protein MsedA_0606 [Metallosphaera sedula]AKV75951.1 hypothetical protein MsedB_0606 [Metallosphaera sedula]AKV78202.1 hypothetical protein MsedC_0605 [Metallosphaera sedula]
MPKRERDIHVALEISSEIFSSALGKSLGLPINEVELVKLDDGRYGLSMDRLEEFEGNNVTNLFELGMALPFEEFLLNVDLKREHVMAKDGKGLIIDHGHTLDAWKPLYYVEQILYNPVTRFDLWATRDSLQEGVEIVKGINVDEVSKTLREAMTRVMDTGICSLFTRQVMEEHLQISTKILRHRKAIVPRFYI